MRNLLILPANICIIKKKSLTLRLNQYLYIMAIEIRNISKAFGKQEVLKDVTLRIEEGEVLGLLGPNGAGKSTLMKILLGLWHADSGSVSAPATHGYLPEQNPLYGEMYVREYLEKDPTLIGQSARSKKAIVEQLILRVGLSSEANKKIRELSKGYKQRVGLAQALLGNPELLILDEPTTGLDPNQLDEIRALIRELGKDRTVILSTHILQEVKEMCTRVVILDRGEIKADMAMSEIDDLEALFRKVTKG